MKKFRKPDIEMSELDKKTKMDLVDALNTRFLFRVVHLADMRKRGEIRDFDITKVSDLPKDLKKIRELTHMIAEPEEIKGFVNDIKKDMNNVRNGYPLQEETLSEEKLKMYKEYLKDSYRNEKIVWGVSAPDNLTGGSDPSLNDIELVYHKDVKAYKLYVESVFEFEKSDGAVIYLQYLLSAFTDWMKENGYETELAPSLGNTFGSFYNKYYDSIEEAYMNFKMQVLGFCSLYEKKKGNKG